MKLLNVNDNQKFCGAVMINGEEVHINTNNGAGFHRVFELLQGAVVSLAKVAQGYCNDFDDAKQEACLFMLEGMLKYESDRGSFASFLYTYSHNKIIDNIRKKKIETIPVKNIENFGGVSTDADKRVELSERTKDWNEEWRSIIFRIVIEGEQVHVVAEDIGMSPWGLTRAIRRRLKKARKI